MQNEPSFLAPNRDIIVIGASAGGLEALFSLVSHLPANLPASIFIVHHLPPYSKSNLSQIINRKSPLEAVEARDGIRFEKGKIYCPKADFHLLLEGENILLSKGPKENRFRPSIDALFRSAAYEYKQRVIGVV
ncbi:MAG: chemotaxis protein CheB [Chitinophagales bacterium]